MSDDVLKRLTAEYFHSDPVAGQNPRFVLKQAVTILEAAGLLLTPEREAGLRESIAADIEAYQPAAHPVSCPPSIVYAAAMETAARIAREGSGEADGG